MAAAGVQGQRDREFPERQRRLIQEPSKSLWELDEESFWKSAGGATGKSSQALGLSWAV